MRRKMRRMIATVLSAALLLTMLPLGVFAESETSEQLNPSQPREEQSTENEQDALHQTESEEEPILGVPADEAARLLQEEGNLSQIQEIKEPAEEAVQMLKNADPTTDKTVVSSGIYLLPEDVGGQLEYDLYEDGTVCITGGGWSENRNLPEYLELPAQIEGHPVTAIGPKAFYDDYSCSVMVVPEGVTTIGKAAFYYVKYLQLPTSVMQIEAEKKDSSWRYMRAIAYSGTKEQWAQIHTNLNPEIPVYYQTAVNPETGKETTYLPHEGASYLLKCEVWLDGTIAITGHTEQAGMVTGDLVLPSIVDGKPVMQIGADAFWGCTGLNGKVVIPEGVKEIGESAFYGCKNVKYLQLPKTLTMVQSGAFAFGRPLLELAYTGTQEQWEQIQGHFGFAAPVVCESTLPDNVGETGTCTPYEGASYQIQYRIGADGNITITGHTGDTNISGRLELPDTIDGKTVTRIGSKAFKDCKNLTGELVLPKQLVFISDQAFKNCSQLTGSLILPETLKEIDMEAFFGCRGFTGELQLPASLRTIAEKAFYNCGSLSGNLIVPEGVTDIGAFAWDNVWEGFKMKLAELPTTLRSVGYGAFGGKYKENRTCSGVFYRGTEAQWDAVQKGEYWDLPVRCNSTIPEEMLSEHTWLPYEGASYSLKYEIQFDDTIKITGHTGDATITGQLVLPDQIDGRNISVIAEEAFSGCSGLTGEWHLPAGLKRIEEKAFMGCSGLTGDLVIPEGVTVLKGWIFQDCSNLRSVVLPEGLLSMGSWIFYECESLQSVTLPKGLKGIPDRAFQGCWSLTNIELPDSVKVIGANAFNGCNSLKEIVIPEGVQELTGGQFNYCRNLEKITIPQTMERFDLGTFGSCYRLKQAVYAGTKSEWKRKNLEKYLPKGIEIQFENKPALPLPQNSYKPDPEEPFAPLPMIDSKVPYDTTRYATVPVSNPFTNMEIFLDGTTLRVRDRMENLAQERFTITFHAEKQYEPCEGLVFRSDKNERYPAQDDAGYEYSFAFNAAGEAEVWADLSVLPDGIYWFGYDIPATGFSDAHKVVVQNGQIWFPLDENDYQENYALHHFQTTVDPAEVSVPMDRYPEIEQLAQTLVKDANAQTDIEKLTVIYEWVCDEIYYDYYDYYEEGDRTTSVMDAFAVRKGVCGNYSMILETMLRAVGIPCIYTAGDVTFTPESHAWNNVYLDGEWQLIDATWDSENTFNSDYDRVWEKGASSKTNFLANHGGHIYREKGKNYDATVQRVLPYEGATYQLKYMYDTKRDGVVITGVFGTANGTLVIPDRIHGKKVTAIAPAAFAGETAFTGELVLGRNLVEIGDYAFSGCSGFTSVVIPFSVKIIRQGAFKDCNQLQKLSYAANEEQWAKITIEPENEPLLQAEQQLNPLWEVKVTYDANGGSGAPEPQIKQEQDKEIILTMQEPVRAGYTFEGWSESQNGPVQYYPGEAYTSDQSVTLYAVWNRNKYKITVRSVGFGMAQASAQEAIPGTQIFLYAQPMGGAHLQEWQVISGDIAITEDQFTMPEQDVVIQAVFAEDAVPTQVPTAAPTAAPTTAPTTAPTAAPTTAPTAVPTVAPTTAPTAAPTDFPTDKPEEKTGWVKVDSGWKYRNEDGSYVIDDWLHLNNIWYYCDKDGYMLTGWQNLKTGRFYFDPWGHMSENRWEMIDGKFYYFNEWGHNAINRWEQVDGLWYWFDAEGQMVTGWNYIDGNWYYFDIHGTMLKDWQYIETGWFYFNESGHMLTGWQWINGSWFYMNEWGQMAENRWEMIDGIFYYFNEWGQMATNWQYIDGQYYYFDQSGHMLTGWQWIDGDCYYFYSSGAMAANTWIGNSYVNGSGVWVA